MPGWKTQQAIPVLNHLFLFAFSVEGSTPELGCERWKPETQKCFMNNIFVWNQKPSKLSPLAVVWTPVRWELVLGACLFVVMVSKGGKPSHSIGFGIQSSWRTGHTMALCDGVITVAAQTWGCANFVTDSLVWLPYSALLKSPCPETIHHIPSTCLQTQAGRTGYRNVKDHF